MWTKKDTVLEFPVFECRDIGGYLMRKKSEPHQARQNNHPPRRKMPVISYKNLDTDTPSPKPKKKKKPVPKDGPSADRMAAHKFYLRSTKKENPSQEQTSAKSNKSVPASEGMN